MNIPTLEEMLKAGIHFGHKSSRWHPKMAPHIFGIRHGVHVIDLENTKTYLEETLKNVKRLASEGKNIVFVTTKPQAREVVKEAALSCDSPYLVERWIGGLLTNFQEIKKLIKKYNKLTEGQTNGDHEKYTKKERVMISKQLEKMDKSLIGLSGLTSIPDVLFIPSMQREKTAVLEANRTGVQIIGVCDTNANPDKADYIIPANDDAVNAIRMISDLVAEAIKEGKTEFENKKAIGQKQTE